MIPISPALIICIIGLLIYAACAEKTKIQLLESIGYVLFWTAALAVFIVWANKSIL